MLHERQYGVPFEQREYTMHVSCHQAVARLVYDALAPEVQEFLRLSDVELNQLVRVPDEVAGDNIFVSGGCALEEAHAHSYKLDIQPDGSLKHATGSAPTVIAQTPREVRNLVREGRSGFDEARWKIGEVIHYATDLTTIWHVSHAIPSEYHASGEKEIAAKLKVLMPQDTNFGFKLPNPKSLYYSCVSVAEETYRLQNDRVLAAQQHGKLTDDPELCKEMLERCCGFSLAVVNYVWKYIAAVKE